MCVLLYVAWGEGHIPAAFPDINRPHPTLCECVLFYVL